MSEDTLKIRLFRWFDFIAGPREPSTIEQECSPNWSVAKRMSFRFLFVYWSLYNSGRLTSEYDEVMRGVSSWLAIHLFQLQGTVTKWVPTGSGDTALHWIFNGGTLAIALVIAIVWSALDRCRPNYSQLSRWLQVLVRYSLASTLLSYGFVKVFPFQFRPPDLQTLGKPLGELNPHGLLWTFMGYSMNYTIFCGAAEVLGGLLLLFPRTTTLGAIISASVLANIVALNFFYDTAVKLFSTNLLFMAIFLIAKDYKRIVEVLVFNRAVPPAQLTPLFHRKRLRSTANFVKILFLTHIGFQAWDAYQGHLSFVEARPPTYGIWQVASWSDPPSNPSNGWGRVRSWKQLDLCRSKYCSIMLQDGSRQLFEADYGTNRLTLRRENQKPLVFTFLLDESNHLKLQGKFVDQLMELKLENVSGPDRLTDWKIHWVQP